MEHAIEMSTKGHIFSPSLIHLIPIVILWCSPFSRGAVADRGTCTRNDAHTEPKITLSGFVCMEERKASHGRSWYQSTFNTAGLLKTPAALPRKLALSAIK